MSYLTPRRDSSPLRNEHYNREPMQDFTLKDSKQIYDGRVVDLLVETITLPDGAEAMREVVRHPGAAAVVPMLSPDEIVLIRQFRYCARKELWEIPAGTKEFRDGVRFPTLLEPPC